MKYKFEDLYLYYFVSVKETSLEGFFPPSISVFNKQPFVLYILNA